MYKNVYEVECYVKKLFALKNTNLYYIIFYKYINNILYSSWIHDCGKMVDWQKALLMVLLALLIYPNDIFGKH